MQKGDLQLDYYGRSYTFTLDGVMIMPSADIFAVDDIVTFETTGTLPTGLTVGINYYIVGFDGTAFAVSAIEAGEPIILSGGSGTHSIRVVLSVVPRYFLDNKPPRQSAQLSGKGGFSVNGNFLVSGINFEAPQEYELRHKASIAERDIYQSMYWTTDKIRRELGSPYIILSDWQREYFEEGKTSATKTRSHVVGTTPRQQNGGVYYYPKLQVFMPSEPLFGQDTGVGNVTAIVSLQETGVKI